MSTVLNPYINFDGQAKEALAFYHDIFGGELTSSTFGESGMPVDEASKDRIMHGQINGRDGLTLMVSDAPMSAPNPQNVNIQISLSGSDEAELTAFFEKLSAGGAIREPLVKAPWGDTFGMLTDRYGIDWMVNITPSQS